SGSASTFPTVSPRREMASTETVAAGAPSTCTTYRPSRRPLSLNPVMTGIAHPDPRDGGGIGCPRRPRRSVLRRLRLGRRLLRARHAEHDLHLLLDLGHHRRVVLEEQLRVLATLADLLAVVAVPGPRL